MRGIFYNKFHYRLLMQLHKLPLNMNTLSTFPSET